MYLNKAIIFGNLTRDPEIKALSSGVKVTSFSLATNRVWKDKAGVKQESVDYHNIVLFGKLAELAGQYLKKRASVLIEGRMQTRSWDDAASGGKKYRTEVIGDSMQFGPRISGGMGAGPSAHTSARTDAKNVSVAAPEIETIEYPEEDINPDDIPF
jgi:single-strand DNA-binding protein